MSEMHGAARQMLPFLPMKSINSQEFLDLKAAIEAHPRLCGYYIIKLVDITGLRSAGKDQEEIAEETFQYFGDQKWPPIDQRPGDQTWADYAVERAVAKNHAIEMLMGGPSIGHTRETIPRTKAEAYFDRFEALFDAPRSYYFALGFGDPEYVFQHGIALISHSLAGVLCIVESD
jgi:hypothetical protein